MVFRNLRRAALGVGGPAVDTVLDNPESFPNAAITGVVRLTGGERDVEIERIVLTLVTRDGVAARELGRQELTGDFRLAAATTRELPLELQVPLATPITHVYGERVPGLAVGVRTELEVAFAHDPGDMDFVAIHPLPAEAAALEALKTLGFRLHSADVSQVFEFWVAPQYQDIATEVAVGFTTGADFVELRVNQMAGTRYNRDEKVDWTAEVDHLMRRLPLRPR
ncbi:sporulation protein [Dactylosporangium sp. NPDC051541]|uniref:sporulation protein n=1 Tax=Dactylosporangium sp. NPDC051541 TaxID=3363977 RepID=UPI0037BDCAD4